jgi:hypothetical protein
MPKTKTHVSDAALKQAKDAERRGDLAAAAQWRKLAEQLAHTRERLDALPQPPDEKARRAELMAELRRRAAWFKDAEPEVK